MNVPLLRSTTFALLLATVLALPAMAQPRLFVPFGRGDVQHVNRLQLDSSTLGSIRSTRPDTLPLTLPVLGARQLAKTTVFANASAEFATYAVADTHALACLVVGSSATILSIVQGASLTTVGPARDGNGYAVVTVPFTGGAACGTLEQHMQASVVEAMRVAKRADVGHELRDTLTMRIAVEIDPSVVRATASRDDLARTYATSLMAVVGQVFERDLAVRLRVTSMRVADSDSTPYPRFGSVFGFIDSAVRYAEASLGHIERDLMVFLVARGAAGGIAASIGGLCMPSFSYCAADVNGTPIPDLPTWSWDASVVAHEIGHVLGAVHTQSCLWPGGPLDSCVQSESGTCVGFMQTRPSIGTLMSYCHQRSSQGGGVRMEFHPKHRTVMRSMVEASSCVGNRPPVLRSTIIGRVLLRDTDSAMPNVPLVLRPWNFSYVQGTPPSAGATEAISDADGQYVFDSVGHGLYSIALPSTVNRWPVTLTSAQEIAPVIVAEDTAYWPLRVVPATPVRISVIGLPEHQSVRMHVVHQNTGLPFYASTITYTDEQRDGGILLDRGIPPGRYAFVPVARGYRFEPNILRVNVHQLRDTIRLAVRAVPVDTAGVHCTVVAVTFISDGSSTLVPNQLVEMRVGDGDVSTVIPLVTNDIGVASILLDSSATRRTLRARWDTTEWVDATPPDILVNHNGSFLYYVNRKRRSEPLIVRPRVVEVEQRPYNALPDDAVVFRPANTISGYLGQRLLPPFEVRVRGSVFDTLWAYINGYMTGGPNPVYDGEGRSVTSYEPSGLVLSPFGARLAYVRDSMRTSTLRSRVVGESPRRWWEVEWNSMGFEYMDTSRRYVINGSATFTIRVQEGTGTVEMHVGRVAIPSGIVKRVEVGMRGADNFDRLMMEPMDVDVPSWTQVRATTGYVEGRSSLVVSSAVLPPEGMLYRFVDPLTTVHEDGQATPRVRVQREGNRLVILGADHYQHVMLIDVMGRSSGSSGVRNGSATIDVDGVASGVYGVWLVGSGTSHGVPVRIGR